MSKSNMFLFFVLINLFIVTANSVNHNPEAADTHFNESNVENTIHILQHNNDGYASLPGIQLEGSVKLDDLYQNYQIKRQPQQQTELQTLQLTINQQVEKQPFQMSETIVCKTLKEYFLAIGDKLTSDTILFHWNKTGSLINISPRMGQPRAKWLDDNVVQRLFSQTNPSKVGTAALLFNSDLVGMYQWTFTPPVPVMFYTLPKDVVDPASKFILVPNPYDRNGFSERRIHGIQAYLKQTNNNDGFVTFDEFSKRKNTIVWRGKLRNHKDRKLLAIMSADHSINRDGWLDAMDSMSPMTVEAMADQYRYQIDIGGCSGTAWDGLRWKMCASGGLVFKVDTFSIDWWHNDLVPWTHYIPVKADLSDLREKYDWAEQNLNEAYEIGVAGRNLCYQSYTEETASQRMIDIVQSLPSLNSQELNVEIIQVFDQNLPKPLFQQ